MSITTKIVRTTVAAAVGAPAMIGFAVAPAEAATPIYYKLVGLDSLCMEVRDSSTANGAQVDMTGCSQDGNQFWRWGSERQLHRQRGQGAAVGLQRHHGAVRQDRPVSRAPGRGRAARRLLDGRGDRI